MKYLAIDRVTLLASPGRIDWSISVFNLSQMSDNYFLIT